jgi:hypothetical protein
MRRWLASWASIDSEFWRELGDRAMSALQLLLLLRLRRTILAKSEAPGVGFPWARDEGGLPVGRKKVLLLRGLALWALLHRARGGWSTAWRRMLPLLLDLLLYWLRREGGELASMALLLAREGRRVSRAEWDFSKLLARGRGSSVLWAIPILRGVRGRTSSISIPEISREGPGPSLTRGGVEDEEEEEEEEEMEEEEEKEEAPRGSVGSNSLPSSSEQDSSVFSSSAHDWQGAVLSVQVQL